MKIYFLLIPIFVGIVFGVLIISEQEEVTSNTTIFNKENLLKGSTILGSPGSKISIVEFGDYQCTYCYKFHNETLGLIMEKYVTQEKVNFVYKDFPLNGKSSVRAAEASYCAQEQNRFWKYHDIIYENWEGENTGWVTEDSLLRFAKEAKLNLDKFSSCMTDSKFRQKVLEHEEFAKKISIDATPSFIIFNDKEAYRIIGAQPFEKFEQVLMELGA